MKRPIESFVVTAAVALALALPVVGLTACGGSSGADTSGTGPSLTVTTASPPTTTPPAAAAATTPAPTTQATSSHVSITHVTGVGPTTATTGTSPGTSTGPSTGSTLSEPPTGTTGPTLGEPPSSSTSWAIGKPSITLDTVSQWQWFEESDLRLSWGGPWKLIPDDKAHGGGYLLSTSDAHVFMQFDGLACALRCVKGPNMGIMKIAVDYSTIYTVDLFSASPLYPTTVWSSGGIGPGVHTLLIQTTPNKNPQSTGRAITFDAIMIYGTLIP